MRIETFDHYFIVLIKNLPTLWSCIHVIEVGYISDHLDLVENFWFVEYVLKITFCLPVQTNSKFWQLFLLDISYTKKIQV